MDENELQEFSLDDIMREFGSDIPAGEEPEVTEEDLFPEETSEPEAESAPEETPVTGDTIRMDPVAVTPAREENITSDTIRLDTALIAKGTVRNAQPIDDEEEEPAPPQPEEAAFDGQWEPEYEQPMGEYIPPQPILVHPRSRLRELKKKLVAGPERLYYQLAEKGVGKLQAALFLSIFVVLVCAVATTMYAFGAVRPERMKLLVFSQFLAMLLSALLGSFQIIEGVADLFKKRFTLNTMLVFTFVACALDGILCLKLQQVPCCAAFSLQVTMSLWGTYHQRSTRLSRLDTMRKATKLDKISLKEGYYEESAGVLRGEGQVEDFMATEQETTKPEKVLSTYALVALGVSVAVAVVAAVLRGIPFGIRVWAVTLLAAMPATIFITLTRPNAVLRMRLHKLGAVICSWKGVKELCQKTVFPVTFDDLFPAGTLQLNGVKFFTDRSPDQTVAYAAALISENGGNLKPLFDYLLESRNGVHYTARQFRAYNGGGIGAVVNGADVLAGSLGFLAENHVEVPEGIRVGNAVCVAVDGELCGIFAVAYEKNRATTAALNTLCSYRGLRPVFTGSQFMITPEFLRSKFGIAVRKLTIPEIENAPAQLQDPEGEALVLTTKDGIAPFAFGVTGARALRMANILGVVIHMVGGIVGILMMLALAILGAAQLLTPANLFLYELIWMIPGILISEWTRSV